MEQIVWVPHLPTRWDAATQGLVPSVDLNDAERFGEIRPMSELGIERDEMIDGLVDACKEVGENDYIMCVGDSSICAIAIALVLVERGTCNTLRWDRPTKQYMPSTTTLPTN